MGKSYAIVFVLLILSAMVLGTLCFHPVKAQYQGNITINADGSTSPSTAPIQQTSNVYSLINDIVGSITVHTSNIILDGSGHNVSSISLQGTSNVTVKDFVVISQGERFGIFLRDVSNNLIINNTVSGFWSIQALNGISFGGISVLGGNSNTITQNNLMNNLLGVGFGHTSYNLIVQNNITSNPVWSPYTTGISFVDASNNTIFRNNFVNNHYQAQVSNSTNVWDDGYLGNYWSDYSGQGTYIIDENNVDHYPQAQQINFSALAPTPTPTIPEFPSGTIPLLLTIIIALAGFGVYLKKTNYPCRDPSPKHQNILVE